VRTQLASSLEDRRNVLLILLESDAGRAISKGTDEVVLAGGLGLQVVRVVVGVVAGERLAARHWLHGTSREELLDVVHVIGVDDGRDVEIDQIIPTTEVDLAEHAGNVGLAVRDSVEVASPARGEVDSGVPRTADVDRRKLGQVSVAGEVDGTLNLIQGPECDARSAGDSRGGDESSNGKSETHFDGWLGFLI